MLGSGSRRVGLTCFGGAGWAGIMAGWTAADDTAAYEYDGDLDFNDISIPLSSVDCETVTLP